MPPPRKSKPPELLALEQLEKRVDLLVKLCRHLEQENKELRGGSEAVEVRRLRSRQKKVGEHLDRLIGRLKQLEQSL